MEKRRLSAKEILQDIRSGLSNSQLTEKYEISEHNLEGVFRKLVEAGALNLSELDMRESIMRGTESLPSKAVNYRKQDGKQLAEGSCNGDPSENTSTSVSLLPKVWIGFVLALLAFLAGIIVIVISGVKGRNTVPLLFAINLPVYAYWLFCIHRFHRLLAELSDNAYPITPDRAAAFHLIPIFNLYWIFKWPIELTKYIKSQGGAQMAPGELLGFLILVSFLLSRVEPAIGFVGLFLIAMYINKRLSVHVGQATSITNSRG